MRYWVALIWPTNLEHPLPLLRNPPLPSSLNRLSTNYSERTPAFNQLIWLFHNFVPQNDKMKKIFAHLQNFAFWNLTPVAILLGVGRFVRLCENVTQVLRSKLIGRFEDHCFRLIANKLFNGLPTQPFNNWSAWGTKAAIRYDSDSQVLKFQFH